MNKEEAKNYIRENAKDYLTPDRSGKGFVCPVCKSGTGKKGTGIATQNGINYTCWAGCYTNADIIDIIGVEKGLTNYNDQLQAAADAFGITIENEYSAKTEQKKEIKTQLDINTGTKVQEEDYTFFFLQAHQNINETSYHRGLSKETLERFKIGFIEDWKHPKMSNSIPSPRLIIPTSKNSYLARDTRENLTESQKTYNKIKVGKTRLFNSKALYEAKKPIFIVEGEIDALSIIDVGGEAIALGSIANKKLLLNEVKQCKLTQPLIIALDNDKTGEKAAKELKSMLEELNITCFEFNPAGEYKDANEALQRDRQALVERVKKVDNFDFDIQQEKTEQIEREEYLRGSDAYYLQGFIDGIADSVNTSSIPTGFKKLDEALDGGLYEGLYFIGAISSLGKTTFTMQVADQVAQSGEDVVIISLEMSRNELMSKSISRHTIQHVLENCGDARNAKTSRGITTGKRYENYSDTEIKLIEESVKSFGQYAQNRYVIEGIGNVSVEQIRKTVENHICYTGKKPVVIIDYLQIVAPCNERCTDKQNIDKTVTELKRISRDFKVPVIAISSLNRASYSTPIGMEAFKESGSIEYSSDVLIGLQLKGVGDKDKDFDLVEAKAKSPREIELVILKNRNGAAGKAIDFKYYPLFNFFKEV